MKKRIGTILICILLIVSSLVIVSPIEAIKVYGDTLYVGGSGPGNFTYIHKAIDAASNGDIIYVFNGTYMESFTIDKSIILMGENKETTKIIVGGQYTIRVKAYYVIIHSFTIDNGGIEIEGDNAIIYDNIFTNSTKGISLGITKNNSIFNNTFFNNGIFLYRYSYNNNIYNNVVNGKKLEYLEKVSNKIIDANTGQVILVNCTNIIAKNLDLSKTTIGVQLINTNNCHIINNIITGGISGISLTYSSNNTISGNNISFCKYRDGIHIVYSSSNNIIIDNILLNNSLYGIGLEDSYNNTISNNIVKNNYEGISLGYRSSRDNIISNNIIEDNENCGISLDCSYNIVRNNILSNNSYGGIQLNSYEHQITNNTFYNDGINVIKSYSPDKNNKIENNTINGRPLIYLKDISNKIIDNAGQIILIRCDGIIIKNQILNNAVIGISLTKTKNCQISENNINSNKICGIRLFDSDSNTITKNIISYNSYNGIFIEQSDQNIFSNNHICNNNRYGVYLYDYIEWGSEFPETSKYNLFIKNNIIENKESDSIFHNSIFNKWRKNFWNDSKIIHQINGEIYLERGWHFGSPPPIEMKISCIDWNPAKEPYDITIPDMP